MANNILKTKIQLCGDTAANWTQSSKILLKGEVGIEFPESGEPKVKIGNGTDVWSALPYITLNTTEINQLISALNASKHSHSNKSVLDATTASFTTALKNKLDNITASADSVAFTSTQTSGVKIGTITINNVNTDLYAPLNSDTSATVTQNLTTASANYPVLLAPSDQTATATNVSYFNTGLKFNPGTKTLTASTFSGALSGNADTATQVYSTLTKPSTGTSYYIPFHTGASSANKSLLNNNGIVYYVQEGTTDSIGNSILMLGNNIASGTAGNKRGRIRLYNTLTGWTDFYTSESANNYNITFPAATGTVALTSNLSSYLPLTGGTITGSIKTSAKGIGYFLTDGTGFSYPGVYDNGTNLWIGSIAAASSHHTGSVYISSGYNASGQTGNDSIYVAVPNNENTNATTYKVLHAGNTSFTQTLTSGTAIGTIKINNTSTTIYAPANTDTKVSITATNPTTATTYYIPFSSSASSSGTGLSANNGLRVSSLEGTASATGYDILMLGNGTESGTAANKYGAIRSYGTGAYYTQLAFGAQTANRTITFPNATGTVALTTSTVSAAKAVSVQAVTVANEDLNNYKTSGIYYFSQTYTPTNIPAGVNGFLQVMVSGSVVKQIWYRHGTANSNDWNTYVRTYTSTWSGWRQYLTGSDILAPICYTGTFTGMTGSGAKALPNRYTKCLVILSTYMPNSSDGISLTSSYVQTAMSSNMAAVSNLTIANKSSALVQFFSCTATGAVTVNIGGSAVGAAASSFTTRYVIMFLP